MADSAVLNAIAQGNHGLLTLCQTPVHLYLLVSVLQQMAENGAPIPVERWWVDFLYDRFILHSIRVNFTSRRLGRHRPGARSAAAGLPVVQKPDLRMAAATVRVIPCERKQ